MKERELSKNIKIDIPVDLRTIYKSSTLKNFFALSTITYNVPSKDTKIEDIIKYVKKYLKDNLTEEQLSPRVNKMEGFEKLIAARLLPLIIKEIGINVIDLLYNPQFLRISFATFISWTGLSDKDTLIVFPIPSFNIIPSPILDFIVPPKLVPASVIPKCNG